MKQMKTTIEENGKVIIIGNHCGEKINVPMVAMVYPKNNPYYNKEYNEYWAYRLLNIRQLTERESLRLMDVSEVDIDKIKSTGLPKNALYHLAGNSIVVACLYNIFKSLYVGVATSTSPTSLFGEHTEKKFKATISNNKINIVTLCSGYDSQCIALRQLTDEIGCGFELKAWSEFDPASNKPLDKQTAVIAHNALFPEYSDRNVGDMTKVDWKSVKETWGDDNEIDILTYSTPCQSISTAGKRAGFTEGSGTTSSILWHTEDAIKHLRPKILLQENVKAIVNSKNMDNFIKWMNVVKSLGYTNYYTVLNAVDFNCPQNRERMFMVSVRDDLDFGKYEFPKTLGLHKTFCELLEDDVPNEYYMNASRTAELMMKNEEDIKNGIIYIPTDHYLTKNDIIDIWRKMENQKDKIC